METGTKILTPAVSSTSLPRLRLEGSSIPSRPSLLHSDFPSNLYHYLSLSLPSQPDSDSELGSLNGPEIGKCIDDNRREMETPAVFRTSSLPLDEGDSEEMILSPTPKEQEQETITKFAAEMREKTPMPKEQETRTKPPLARKKENGVRQYRGVRQRRGGKFGAEIRDPSQKGGKRWFGTFFPDSDSIENDLKIPKAKMNNRLSPPFFCSPDFDSISPYFDSDFASISPDFDSLSSFLRPRLGGSSIPSRPSLLHSDSLSIGNKRRPFLSLSLPSLPDSDSVLGSLNGPEIGKSIDDNRREMETGTKTLTPAVSRTSSLPRFLASPLPSFPARFPVSKIPLDEGDSKEMILSRTLKDAGNKGWRPPTPKEQEQEQETITKFAAEIREKTPIPKEQETRTKPPLATKKENGVGQYRGVRQRRGGKFGAETRDSSQKGDKRWLGTFNSAEEAAHAYDRAAYEMRGSMAWLNFPRDDAFAFAGNNTCPTVEKPKVNASQSTPLPHPSIREISEPFASEQQHDDLEINPVKLASGFAHWPSDSHHSIHPMIIAPHVPAILSQATSLHAHQHKGGKRREMSFQDMHPEVQGEMEKIRKGREISFQDMHPEGLGEKEKGGKRREMSFQDMHPEVQGEMEKRRKGREISFQDMYPEVLGEKEKGGKRKEEVLGEKEKGGKREQEEREKISFQDMHPVVL